MYPRSLPSNVPINAGDVFPVRYPFVRGVRVADQVIGDDWEWKEVTAPTWVPGVENDQYADDVFFSADAEGLMTLTVVSVHRPGRFPTRVFYTRQFTSPDGATFGKPKLRIATVGRFRRLACCYQVEYKLRRQPLSVMRDGR